MYPPLVVIDDESMVHKSFIALFDGTYPVRCARSLREAQELLKDVHDAIYFLDIDLQGENGFDLFPQIKKCDEGAQIVILTGDTHAKSAVKALKMGAYDYITKPFSIDEILAVVSRITDERKNKRTITALRQEIEDENPRSQIVGKSPLIEEMKALIQKVSRAQSTVLITGESGTGKELVARGIHQLSAAGDEPFVAIHCGAIPDTLLESELFGHEKGAFTGACERKMGKFELAGAGTIFLDEISTMPERLQAKLLRVLQEREIERVGGVRTIPLYARVIAATNVDLQDLIAEKKFRQDLYHRLNVIQIAVPPLRSRSEDIPLLLEHFIRLFNKKCNARVKTVSEEALRCMMSYTWPGNVRELANVVERFVLLADTDIITDAYLPDEICRPVIPIHDLPDVSHKTFSYKGERDKFEREIIIRTLKSVRCNQVKAAEKLHIHRNTLLMKLRQYGIDIRELKKECA